MDNKDIFDKLLRFIYVQRGTYNFILSRDTTLERDLRISGDDAYEFFDAFSKEFNIDLSDFDLSKYFAPEGSFALFKLIFLGFDSGKIPLSIGDLENAIIKGKLY
jgi:acyl carrier protein